MGTAEEPLTLGLNEAVAPLVDALQRNAALLRLGVSVGQRGETIIDAGVAVGSSLAAGIAVAEIALGALGRVAVVAGADWPAVEVRTSQPAVACLGSQLAGWRLEDEASGFRALGSGPARAMAAKEAIFAEQGWSDTGGTGTLLLECQRAPPPAITDTIAEACGLHPSQLTLILVPTTSLAGAVQVAARCLEAALGKARTAGFPLADIVDGLATSPLAPPHPDRTVSMGRTNDAMLYGGTAHLFVRGSAAAARDLAAHLPSSVSAHHGQLFADVLAAAGGEFYAVDPLLFGPAVVRVTALASGETFTAGALKPDLVRRSFGLAGS